MYTLKLHNIKCQGCAGTIKRKLESISGLTNPSVQVEEDTISFDLENETSLAIVKEVMAKAGYPQEDPTLGQTAKSYVSCMIGKLTS